MNYSTHTIATVLNREVNSCKDFSINYLLIDSRQLIFPAKTIFFALPGLHTNGHSFIKDLYQKGVRCFVVSENFKTENFSEAQFFKVEDVLTALQDLVAFHRSKFQLPVIGITGSNGKTVVKEMLYQLLQSQFKIVKSPKSYNSQLGVPLSVWQLAADDELGIFEAGISQSGEMESLQKLIQPTIGLFTYLGNAHAAGFISVEEKVKEKLKLFKNCNSLIYNADDKALEKYILSFKENVNKNIQLFTWGVGEADVSILSFSKINNQTKIKYIFKGTKAEFEIPFTDEASVHNAISCLTVLLFLNISFEEIEKKMLQLKPSAMRLEMIKGINNCIIINDSYSADVSSLQIALNFLRQQKTPETKTLILSDIPQTGLANADLYAFIANLVLQKQVHKFVGVGPQLYLYQQLFNDIPQSIFFKDTPDLVANVNRLNFRDETILIKGARQFALEKVSKLLQQKQHQTVLEINLTALRNNLQIIKLELNPEVKIMAMVKAFGYGSGAYEVATELEQAGINYLGVAYTDEAVDLRKAGVQLPIMIMNSDVNDFENIISYQLEPEVYSFNLLEQLINFVKENNLSAIPIHLKVDTGMHRLGFVQADVPALIKKLKEENYFKVVSVFSHLAASDDAALDKFSHQQITEFGSIAAEIESALGYTIIKHIANSAAIHRLPAAQFNMVRLGIGMFGVSSQAAEKGLQQVATLKTSIAQIKLVKKGEAVGYGRHAVVGEDTLVATVRVGYADGYHRSLGNGVGKMLLNGKLVPTLGNICMDMTMLNVNGLEAMEGNEVIVFGKDLPVLTLAGWANSIPYEILTGISQRVKRVYYKE